MENRKYTVNRSDVYVGAVVRTNMVFRHEGAQSFYGVQPGQLITGSYRLYRSMLFVPDSNAQSNDLLYKSPSYPILNITDDRTCLDVKKNNPVITDAINLDELLAYFGYQEELTYQDLAKIRATFFNGTFAKNHCELFGYRELPKEEIPCYGDKIMTEQEGLEYCYESRWSRRVFERAHQGPLSSIYWKVLEERGDNDFQDALLNHKKTDAFLPDKEEGHIKKLSLF